MFFKGYVLTQNKQCIEKFKGRTSLKSYEEVEKLPEFAGILSERTILVDIDDYEQSEILFNIVKAKQLCCRVYQTTRGKHFLFDNPNLIERCKTHTVVALGIQADFKLGSRNSYEVLKFDGKKRAILYDTTGDNEQAQIIPKWLFPVKTTPEFLKMKTGDGRNQTFFNYILTLQTNNFTMEEIRECIKLINEFVVKEPLSDSELDTILRDEAFQKPIFFKDKAFLFDKFAMFLKNTHHIIRINNQLHIYKNGLYIPGQAEIESFMIKHIQELNKAKRSEVMAYLDILIRENTPIADAKKIAFRNGVFNLDDDSLVEFSPEHIITNVIPWDYNPNAYFKLTDEVLDNIACHDKEIRNSLEEMIGYCMFRRNELGKAFFLTGGGSNGKSTFLNMLKTMLGRENLSVLELKKLDDRFSTIMMFGKLANIGDDISDEFVTDSAFFKKIVTGESIDAEQKGLPKFEFDPYVKLIFSANNIPRIGRGRDSSAILRRLIIIPFNANFNSKSKDFKPFIGDDLKSQESMEYLVKLGVNALKRLLANRQFTISKAMQDELDEFEEINNPVLGFFHEVDRDTDTKIENEPTNNVYRAYQEYCIINNLMPISAGEFSKQVKKYYKLTIKDKKIQGKKYRIFMKE